MTMSIQEATEMLTAPGQMFEMETIEIRGVPTRVWKNTPASLRDVLELSRGHGDADFLVYEDDRISFEEHFRQAAHLARVLVERFGVEKGDRVAIVMRNFPEWVAAFWVGGRSWSSPPSSMRAPPPRADWRLLTKNRLMRLVQMLRWVPSAPLGRPVVPEV